MTIDTAQPKTAACDPLGGLLCLLAVAALALAPTQLTVPVGPVSLHPAEPLLALAAVVWAVRWLWVRDTRSLPPLSHWLLVAAGVLSLFALMGEPTEGSLRLPLLDAAIKTAALKTWMLETAQAVLYLLVAVTIFRAALTTPARLRAAAVALLATTTLAVALALAQRVALARQYTPDPAQRAVFTERTPQAYFTAQTPLAVCATFGNWDEHGYHPSRAGYAAFLALVLPFALALLATDRRKGVRLWMALLLTGAAASVLAGMLVPAILLGLLTTGLLLGPRVGRGVLFGALLYLAGVAVLGGLQRGEVLREPFRLTIGVEEAARLYDGTRHVKKFWAEQQAALNVLKNNPLLGIGSGQYQDKINQAYDLLSAATTQRLEPDAQNGYLLTAVNGGILGVAALLALLGGYLGMARRQALAAPRDPWTAALCGSLVALLVLLLATNPWVRGTSILIAALFGALGARATNTPPARIIEGALPSDEKPGA